MANLTPEEILRGIIDGSIEELDLPSLSGLNYRKLSYCQNLTKLRVPSATFISPYALSESRAIVDFDASNVSSISTYGCSSAFGPIEVEFPKLTNIGGGYAFRDVGANAVYCPNLVGSTKIGAFVGESSEKPYGPVRICAPKATSITGGAGFSNNRFLQVLDVGIESFPGYELTNCYVLQTLIFRKSTSPVSLANTTSFTNSPVRGYQGRTATIYIPEVLYDHLGDGSSLDYQSATNWSTYYDNGFITFAKIEGSQYESETWYEDDPLDE